METVLSQIYSVLGNHQLKPPAYSDITCSATVHSAGTLVVVPVKYPWKTVVSCLSLLNWCPTGIYQRNDDGSVICMVAGFEDFCVTKMVSGKLHRINGPAVKSYYFGIQWRQKGKDHRSDGPARVTHFSQYSLIATYWVLHSCVSRGQARWHGMRHIFSTAWQ